MDFFWGFYRKKLVHWNSVPGLMQLMGPPIIPNQHLGLARKRGIYHNLPLNPRKLLDSSLGAPENG